MTTQVQSFHRASSGELLPVGELEVLDDDLRYWPGSIEILIDGAVVVPKDAWDYPIDLWFYLASVVESYLEEGGGTTLYPDQPLRIRLEKEAPSLARLTFSEPHAEVASAVESEEALVGALLQGGLAFFSKLNALRGDGEFDSGVERFESLLENLV